MKKCVRNQGLCTEVHKLVLFKPFISNILSFPFWKRHVVLVSH